MVYPKGSARPIAKEVPEVYKTDFSEAAVVLPDSPKASSAISRRCLQNIIRDELKIKRDNLDKEIQAVLDANLLPHHIAENLDAIRQIGNFAAHPIKSVNTGEVTDVEPGEGQWTLDILEELFE